MSPRSVLAGVMAAALLASPARPQMMIDVPAPDVMIGKDGPELDACGAVGVIVGPDAAPDAPAPAVEVYNNTQSWRDRLDRLQAGREVWMCDSKAEWTGIVYPADAAGDLGDCGVASPVPAPRIYRGPCRSGWVKTDAVGLLAG